jgi:hypothetical protein
MLNQVCTGCPGANRTENKIFGLLVKSNTIVPVYELSSLIPNLKKSRICVFRHHTGGEHDFVVFRRLPLSQRRSLAFALTSWISSFGSLSFFGTSGVELSAMCGTTAKQARARHPFVFRARAYVVGKRRRVTNSVFHYAVLVLVLCSRQCLNVATRMQTATSSRTHRIGLI